MFGPGFFNTAAPLYLDIVTLYFILLPFLLFYSIRSAAKGRLRAHHRSQAALLVLTLVMVVFFEIGMRREGGYTVYLDQASQTAFPIPFLVVHILLACVTLAAWLYQTVSANRAFKIRPLDKALFRRHAERGRWIFGGIVITATMGVIIYALLFF